MLVLVSSGFAGITGCVASQGCNQDRLSPGLSLTLSIAKFHPADSDERVGEGGQGHHWLTLRVLHKVGQPGVKKSGPKSSRVIAT
jgi:hypothetical protein